MRDWDIILQVIQPQFPKVSFSYEEFAHTAGYSLKVKYKNKFILNSISYVDSHDPYEFMKILCSMAESVMTTKVLMKRHTITSRLKGL